MSFMCHTLYYLQGAIASTYIIHGIDKYWQQFVSCLMNISDFWIISGCEENVLVVLSLVVSFTIVSCVRTVVMHCCFNPMKLQRRFDHSFLFIFSSSANLLASFQVIYNNKVQRFGLTLSLVFCVRACVCVYMYWTIEISTRCDRWFKETLLPTKVYVAAC